MAQLQRLAALGSGYRKPHGPVRFHSPMRERPGMVTRMVALNAERYKRRSQPDYAARHRRNQNGARPSWPQHLRNIHGTGRYPRPPPIWTRCGQDGRAPAYLRNRLGPRGFRALLIENKVHGKEHGSCPGTPRFNMVRERTVLHRKTRRAFPARVPIHDDSFSSLV
jgi:hypothetical protein